MIFVRLVLAGMKIIIEVKECHFTGSAVFAAIRFQKSFKIIFPRLHPICCSYSMPCAIIRSWLWARWFDLTVALACTDVYRFKIITNAMCFSIYQSAHYVPAIIVHTRIQTVLLDLKTISIIFPTNTIDIVIRENSKVVITYEKLRQWISRTLPIFLSRFRARKKRGNTWKRKKKEDKNR